MINFWIAFATLNKRAKPLPMVRTGDAQQPRLGGQLSPALAVDKIVRSTHGVNCTGSCSWKTTLKMVW